MLYSSVLWRDMLVTVCLARGWNRERPLPPVESEQALASLHSSVAGESAAMSEPLNLFLLEDVEDVARSIRAALERAGHRVTRCRTSADALIVLGHGAFDLALLKHRILDLTGLDLLHTISREHISVPVLLLTAPGDEEVALNALRAGALDCVEVDPGQHFLNELAKRVLECVEKHRLGELNCLLIQALESASDGIMITDLQGSILHVNSALEEVTGYRREELLGRSPRVLKSDRHPAEFYRQMWQTLLGRTSWRGELLNRRKDGSLYEASMTISPIFDQHGSLTHFVGIQRDVTAHKQLQRQLLQAQKMQSVGTLAGGIAHEFNNLLAGIGGYAALGLLEANLSEELRDVLRNIASLSERAAGLTRQLLAFARTPVLTRRPTALDVFLRDTVQFLRQSLRIEVALNLPDSSASNPTWTLEVDANQLQQALVNLAINSRDAIREKQERRAARTGDGQKQASPEDCTITFRLREVHFAEMMPAFPHNVPAGEYLLLEVEDTGCGMPPEVLSQAIDPFFTTKEVGQGTGLGLAVVFGVVQGHQGYLTIRSAPGEGTCTSLYLPCRSPLVAAPLPNGEGKLARLDLEPDPAPHYHILVLDDEEAVLDVIRRFLQLAGHRVTAASSGAQALELLSKNVAVDLVILDWTVSGDQGTTLIRRLRERFPTLPILTCLSGEPGEFPRDLRLEPSLTTIRKPFRMHELWFAVRQAIAPDRLAVDSEL